MEVINIQIHGNHKVYINIQCNCRSVIYPFLITPLSGGDYCWRPLCLVHIMLSKLNGISAHRFNTLRPRQNERHFADDIFKWLFLNENVWISIKISLKFVPQGPIDNIPALVQIMAWRLPGDKPLSGPMIVRLPMHICVTRPQSVNKKPSLR